MTIADPYVHGEQGERSAQIISIDVSRHAAVVAVCAVVCGICVAVSWWAIAEQRAIGVRFHDDSVDMQDQYQKERNHVIELEARLNVLSNQVQELTHVPR